MDERTDLAIGALDARSHVDDKEVTLAGFKGECLFNTDSVKASKHEEVDLMAKLNVWSCTTAQEAKRESGRRPLGCCWVTADAGDPNDLRYGASS